MNTASLAMTGTMAAECNDGVWSSDSLTNDTLTVGPSSEWSEATHTLIIDAKDTEGGVLSTLSLAYTVDSDTDADQDGFPQSGDCNDSNAAVNPGATELCDGIDNNCDGQTDENGAALCDDTFACTIDSCHEGKCVNTPSNMVCYDGNPCTTDLCDPWNNQCDPAGCVYIDANGIECDDGSLATSNDTCQDGICSGTPCTDSDSDGICDIYESDQDADGYDINSDCNDHNASINAGATDVPGNDWDENCDGHISCYVDADDDSYGSSLSSESSWPATGGSATTAGACGSSLTDGYDDDATDCDDSDPGINPDAAEIIDDGIDQNCNGSDAV
jgi:hypothetical protein